MLQIRTLNRKIILKSATEGLVQHGFCVRRVDVQTESYASIQV